MALCKNNTSSYEIISGGEDYSIKIWNWEEGACLKQFNTNKAEIWSLLQIGNTVFSGHKDGVIRLIDCNKFIEKN